MSRQSEKRVRELCKKLNHSLTPKSALVFSGNIISFRRPPLALKSCSMLSGRRKVYDCLIIGSGASGGWVAKELTERGLTVLMLEAGLPRVPTRDFTEHVWPYQLKFRGFGNQEKLLRTQPVQRMGTAHLGRLSEKTPAEQREFPPRPEKVCEVYGVQFTAATEWL